MSAVADCARQRGPTAWLYDTDYAARDAWFPSDWATAWKGLDLSCQRSPSCVALGGSAGARMRALIDDIRRQPISGQAPDGLGALQPVTLDTGALIRLIDASGNGASIYRDIDAAARAWLDRHDAQPILRVVAENATAVASNPTDFSSGLATAVTCGEYPLLYDLNAPFGCARASICECARASAPVSPGPVRAFHSR